MGSVLSSKLDCKLRAGTGWIDQVAVWERVREIRALLVRRSAVGNRPESALFHARRGYRDLVGAYPEGLQNMNRQLSAKAHTAATVSEDSDFKFG